MTTRTPNPRVAALFFAAAMAGCSAPAGPTIGFRNDTDTFMRVRFYSGDRDPSHRGGAKLRLAEDMQVRARSRAQASFTHLWEYRSAAETVVRVQVQPAGASFENAEAAPAEYWFELSPPPPYVVKAVKGSDGFHFEREGGGTLVGVPREFWLDGP